MTLRTPTLPEAIIASTFTVAVLAVALTLTTLNSRRFVQVEGQRETILDSRTGCIWRMGVTPPIKSCPGDRSKATSASDVGTAASAALTPDSFMAGQQGPEAKPDHLNAHVNAPALAQALTVVVLSLGTGLAALWWAFRRTKQQRAGSSRTL